MKDEIERMIRVDQAGEFAARRLRRGGYRHDDLGGRHVAQRLDRREHAGAGGEPVVDQDHRSAGQLQRCAPAAIGRLATLQFAALPFGRLAQLLGRDTQSPHHVVVDDDPAAAGHGRLAPWHHEPPRPQQHHHRCLDARSHTNIG